MTGNDPDGDGWGESDGRGPQSLLVEGGPVSLERPRRPEFGDYSTNAALVLGPSAREPSPASWRSRWGRR